jgi:pilus assembly protein FimV
MRRLSLIATMVVSCASSTAFAWGLDQVSVQSSLGQPLRSQVKLIGADVANAESGCFKAALVGVDGSVISPVKAKIVSDGTTANVMLSTTRAINEPAVMLELAYQCPPQIRREYGILLDPPIANSAPVIASSRAKNAPAAAEPTYMALPNDSQTDVVPEPKKKRRRAVAPSAVDGNTEQTIASVGMAEPTNAKAAPVKKVEKPTEKPVKNVLRLGSGTGNLTSDGEMRLSLSYSLSGMPAPVDAQSATAPMPEAAPDTLAAAADAELKALQEKILALEVRTDRLRQLNVEQQAALDVAHKKEVKSDSWMYLYLALLAGVVIAIGWLIWRMRQLRSELVQSSWHEMLPQHQEDDEDDADNNSAQSANQEDDIKRAPLQAAAPYAMRPAAQTTLHPAIHTNNKNTPTKFDDAHDHDYTFTGRMQSELTNAEEVLDEIQQAEFWMYMNQPLRAIEILEAKNHPTSPLPWLYLFDLYRTVNNQAMYEDLAARFKTTFNCRVTPWEENHVEHSRGLEDFPVMARIIEMWPHEELVPFLENLLIDDRDGQRQGFDLGAYRDLLFLTNIAYRIQPSKALI